MLAITACPPFGPFFSELKIVLASLAQHKPLVAAAFLACLFFAFLGMTRLVFAIVDGRPHPTAGAATTFPPEKAGVIVPALAFLGLSLWLGLATPAVLSSAWTDAAKLLFSPP
jgi:hydrogenase-4 component F